MTTENKFLHIGINFESGVTDVDALKAVFDKAIDWVRYAPNCWILYTAKDVEVWYARIKQKLDSEDTFLIFEINMNNYTGYLPEVVREWIKKRTISSE